MFYNQSENEVGKPGAETSGKVEGGVTYADCHDGAFLAPSGSLLKASNPDPETIRATFSDMATVAQVVQQGQGLAAGQGGDEEGGEQEQAHVQVLAGQGLPPKPELIHTSR